jgi:hypothetical protein
VRLETPGIPALGGGVLIQRKAEVPEELVAAVMKVTPQDGDLLVIQTPVALDEGIPRAIRDRVKERLGVEKLVVLNLPPPCALEMIHPGDGDVLLCYGLSDGQAVALRTYFKQVVGVDAHVLPLPAHAAIENVPAEMLRAAGWVRAFPKAEGEEAADG